MLFMPEMVGACLFLHATWHGLRQGSEYWLPAPAVDARQVTAFLKAQHARRAASVEALGEWLDALCDHVRSALCERFNLCETSAAAYAPAELPGGVPPAGAPGMLRRLLRALQLRTQTLLHELVGDCADAACALVHAYAARDYRGAMPLRAAAVHCAPFLHAEAAARREPPLL
jgi:hypothetical protein